MSPTYCQRLHLSFSYLSLLLHLINDMFIIFRRVLQRTVEQALIQALQLLCEMLQLQLVSTHIRRLMRLGVCGAGSDWATLSADKSDASSAFLTSTLVRRAALVLPRFSESSAWAVGGLLGCGSMRMASVKADLASS
mmetsp:Transcript_49865/g.73254  ORF Transcript_49865/g.73254 Transcript_49865/m.73254 type:complete len:137 (-) Transcript_49865:3380-3790(-)